MSQHEAELDFLSNDSIHFKVSAFREKRLSVLTKYVYV